MMKITVLIRHNPQFKKIAIHDDNNEVPTSLYVKCRLFVMEIFIKRAFS